MNKKVKWGIIIFIGAGLIGGGIYSQLPKENKELAAADKVMSTNRNNKRILNVNAKIIKPQLLKDEIKISGSLLPDEEVDLSFETSGKIGTPDRARTERPSALSGPEPAREAPASAYRSRKHG